LSHASRPLAGASRYAAAVEVVPDPLTEPAAFVDAAAGIVQRRAIRVVMPVAEQSHLAILPARDRFAPAIVTAGSAESFRELSSKDAVLRAADRLSIPVPRQLEIPTRDAIPNEIDPALFPGVLKPAHSVQAGALFRVMYAEDVSAARRTLDALPASAFPLLVQQRIVGQGTGIFALVWNGRLVAARPGSSRSSGTVVSSPPSPIAVFASNHHRAARASTASRSRWMRICWRGRSHC